ncbi:helix-turn-helix domain-containing protein [Endothiovibrio diazotrophicus]
MLVKSEALIDATLQAAAQAWVPLEIHQIGSGTYRGTCTSLNTGGMRVVHEDQNRLVHKTGTLPQGRCTVSMFLRRNPAMRFSHFQHPERAQIFVLPGDTELDIQVPGGIDTVYVLLDQERLMAGARILDEPSWKETPRELQAFHTPDADRLANDLTGLLNPSLPTGNTPRPPLSPQVEALLLDTILLSLSRATRVSAGDTPDYLARRRASQRVKVAREFIDASLQAGRVPSIVEICAETGASARTLQYAFRETMQLTPVAYLRILRLNRTRSALRAATTAATTVTYVATDLGFFHLGEFARDYQRLFGEYPSETLNRALSRITA